MNTYPILDVPDEADLPEQLGSKEKFWFCVDESPKLFKLGRRGENWAEKVACELCELLGMPHAHYDFGVWKGRQGIVSPSIVPSGGRLTLGNEQLEKSYVDYPTRVVRGVSQHTVSRVAALMQPSREKVEKVLSPLDWEASANIRTALDVFVGYLMLDAWIGNTDRHHENWGFILTESGSVHLAPTFDHASSLGCHETDANKSKRMTTSDSGFNISSYVKKANSALYLKSESPKPLSTLDAFRHIAKNRKLAALAWLDRLENTDSEDCRNMFTRMPQGQINDISKEFALIMLELNKKRLLALRDQLT